MKNKIIIITFIAYIAIISIGSIILRDREFSDMENRTLKTFPELTLKTVVNGKFMSEFEDYMSDQIIFKDEYVKLDTSVSYLMGQRLINGVYFVGDRIVQDYKYDEKVLGDNIRYINEFKEAHPEIPINMLITANASYIYRDELPYGAPIDNQGKALDYIHSNLSDDIVLTDVTDAFEKEKDDNIFFRTDHHWTQHGAGIAYTYLAEDLGVDVPNYLQYKNGGIDSDPFYGTL
ncbi:MAG: hypothetical protein K5750_02795, partial [Eubacterium sp.]|nr:hypothetical protein [Eubacterium sp.]